MTRRQMKVVVVKDRDGYYALAPELKGCQVNGDTLDEVLANLRQVVEDWFWTLDDEQLQAMERVEITTTTIEVLVGDRNP